MDINQKLEFIDFNADVLTENDVVDFVTADEDKLVTAKGILSALAELSCSINRPLSSCQADINALSTTLKRDYYNIKQVYNVDEIFAILAGYQLSGNYLTSHQSLSDFYTKREADEKFITTHQSLSDYYSRSQTSSSSELADAFAKIKTYDGLVFLSDVIGKLALSSIADLELDRYQLSGNYVSVDQLTTYCPVKVADAISSLAEAKINAVSAEVADVCSDVAVLSTSVDTQVSAIVEEIAAVSAVIDSTISATVDELLSSTALLKLSADNIQTSAIGLQTSIVEVQNATTEKIELLSTAVSDTYMPKSETSSATDLQNALSTLSSSTKSYVDASIVQISTVIISSEGGLSAVNVSLSAVESAVSALSDTLSDVISYVDWLDEYVATNISSANEIDTKFAEVIAQIPREVNLSNYYAKSQTSSASEIDAEFSNYTPISAIHDIVSAEVEHQLSGKRWFTDCSVFNSLECLPDQGIDYYIASISSIITALQTAVADEFKTPFQTLSCVDDGTGEYYITSIQNIISALKTLK